MGNRMKIWLIIATILVLIGCVVFGGVMMALKWDFSKLSTVKFESNNYQIDEGFKGISINCDTADIVLVASQDEYGSVICFEAEKVQHSVSVKDGVLVIEQVDTRKWYDHISIISHTPKITVSVPGAQYDALTVSGSTGDITIPKEFGFETMDISLSTGDVANYASATSIKIAVTTGDIRTENISADTVTLSTSTGDISASSVACAGDLSASVSTGDAKLTDVVCNTLTSTGNTGDIKLKNVTAAEQFSIKRTTGDVKFEHCDAGALSIETSTGSVTGSLLSEKIFITETNTGDVDVPKSTTGGICQITTSTGDIEITVG